MLTITCISLNGNSFIRLYVFVYYLSFNKSVKISNNNISNCQHIERQNKNSHKSDICAAAGDARDWRCKGQRFPSAFEKYGCCRRDNSGWFMHFSFVSRVYTWP